MEYLVGSLPTPKLAIYLIVVFAIGACIGALTFYWLRKAETLKRRLLKQRDIEEPIEPENTPLNDSEEISRRRGLRSIEQRFRILRRFLIPLFILIWGLVAAVPLVSKVSATYISLIVGAVTVMLGIAAKPWVENFFAGLVITLGQSIRVGDTVDVDGQYGTVEEINLTYCVIKVWDWRRYIIPNAQMLSKEFTNLTIKDSFIWQKVEFFVAPEADLDLVETVAIQAAKLSDALILEDEISFWVMSIEKDSIRCWVAAWAETPAEAWRLGHDIRKNIAMQLNEHGIWFNRSYHSANIRQRAEEEQATR